MNRNKGRKPLNKELFGGIAGIFVIFFAIAAFLDMENTSGFLALATGTGILVNGVFAWIRFEKGRKVSGILLSVFTLVLLIIFLVQALYMEGFL